MINEICTGHVNNTISYIEKHFINGMKKMKSLVTVNLAESNWKANGRKYRVV